MLEVSIITINYNNSQLTKDFVDSVIQHTPPTISYEIIIVDNCSEIDDFKNLKRLLLPYDLKLIESNINLGFGGGNMLGVQQATGKYLAFINSDVLFIENCFSNLIPFMEENPTVGVVSPQILDKELNPTYSFDHFHGIRKLLFGTKMVEITSKVALRKKMKYNSIFQVDLILGSFMFFKAEAFSLIRGFDTNIFFYYEEMDLCYRLKKIGYSSYLNPTTSYVHLEGASTKQNYKIKKERNLSRLYTLRKNHNYLKYNIIRFYFATKWFFKALFKFRHFELFIVIIKGSYSGSSLKHDQKIRIIK
ncbi:MAG: glycosyltransferase family 2 protein [Flavobacteriaceae bacterium]|nr:glycosyltransferase family 2 protein [Flavobacteriaceae bacterium]